MVIKFSVIVDLLIFFVVHHTRYVQHVWKKKSEDVSSVWSCLPKHGLSAKKKEGSLKLNPVTGHPPDVADSHAVRVLLVIYTHARNAWMNANIDVVLDNTHAYELVPATIIEFHLQAIQWWIRRICRHESYPRDRNQQREHAVIFFCPQARSSWES